MVWIYPRRKAGEEDAGTPAKGRPAMQLGYSAVAALFDMTQAEAAQRLGISITALKGVSRKLGISRLGLSDSIGLIDPIFRGAGGVD
jgi:hypothetical protein